MYQHFNETVNRSFERRRSVHCKIQSLVESAAEIIYEQIECIDEDDAFATEKRLIALYGRKDLGTGSLCNLTDGGEGGSNTSPESVRRRAAKHKGSKRSDEARASMRRAQLNSVARRVAETGHKRDPASVAKQAAATKGRAWSDAAKTVVREKPTARPVVAFLKTTGEQVGEWESIALCAKELNCHLGSVWKILSGYQTKTPDGILRTCKSTKGYTFKYKEGLD